MPKIAICYFGLTRSTKKVYKSHIDNFFNVLKNHGCQYEVFMHTWETEEPLIWEQKSPLPIDYEEYKLLTPNYYQIDKQTDFLNLINFSDYFYEHLYKIYGGDTPHEWRPLLIRNHLCALESQKRVTDMVLNSNKIYDLVIYVRPDVMINNVFDIKFLSLNKTSISIPDCDHYEGYNDRFAIVNFNECSNYGKRIDEIIEFRKKHGRIVSEKYVKYIINKYYTQINFINFKFTIIRP